ncbi:uncharacterized protein LOC122070122 [Macadamia integrifolia]|uniref:uncharacterized protein LOC122070122 n=1 Tax=Macadamia integrifolia TaxID=60698 RepID=UPI001C4E4282|nr:uncharacterized protein LOC122070122 [Macadamia integrifolia]
MARATGLYICLFILAMDVVAGILGIEAEIAQNKAKHIRVSIFECKEPSHGAFKLGLAAASILALAHVIANLLGGCVCICSKDQFLKASANRQLQVLCLFLLWIIAAVGLLILIIGVLANSKSKGSCGFSHRHLMFIGGILCFFHGLFCVIYYASANAAKGEEEKRGHRGSRSTGGA